MHVICSYCGRYIKEKEPLSVTTKTHGICQECFMPLLAQNIGISFDEYLETFDAPIVIVDSQRRITAANQAALNMIEKPIERILGVLGGEALECRYSRLPGGCGKTIHCETCTIRNLVSKTLEQRVSHYDECITMDTEKGRVSYLVSTIFYDGLVQIVFE
jgi:PAS domain-containing protein